MQKANLYVLIAAILCLALAGGTLILCLTTVNEKMDLLLEKTDTLTVELREFNESLSVIAHFFAGADARLAQIEKETGTIGNLRDLLPFGR